MKRKGKLIVIDGIDKTGKATQSALLVKRLKREGHTVRTISFPQYKENLFGAFVGKCLKGEHGDFANVDPYIASVLYAADRFEAKAKIENWLDKGYIVIADRYVSANQIHQGGKIKDPKKRRAFLAWLSKMEYEAFGVPRPDKVIHLSLPVAVSLSLMHHDKGRPDSVETNLTYVKNSYKSAQALSDSDRTWVTIECAARGAILPRDVIHERVAKEVLRVIHR